MKILKLILSLCLLNSISSCGICIPTNLEFKNIKYFTSESLNGIDINSEYKETAAYEATIDLKRIINQPREPGNIVIKIQPNGQIKADFWPSNNKQEQGIIYTKRRKLLIDKIGSTQDRCKFIETYRIKLSKDKIILIQYGGITNQKNVYEYSKKNN